MWVRQLPILATALTVWAGGAAAQQQLEWKIGDQLIGTAWQAATVAGTEIPDPKVATLEFIQGDHVRGQAGCNRFVGPFASRHAMITMGPLRTTRMACPAAEAANADKLLHTLERVQRVELNDERDSLVLHGGPGTEPSRFVPAR